uniref:Zinc-ribbon domain-containing protein n=1 Tax=uncultured Chloroflexota bacterium TaxID=166587 RepID=H5SAL8_9CHLR|nr:hypothetical protein HGMM_F05B10C26 [uncultured Chloroflexota bacterium]
MRKLLILLFLFFPLFKVQAQTAPLLEEVRVQLLPEEDKPSVLVLYDLRAPDNASFPITLEIPLPPQAELNAVAREEAGTLITVEHQLVAGGEAVRFTLTDAAFYRLEYYFPFEKKGIHRHFVYRWPGTYAVRTFSLELKEPLNTQNLVTSPILTNVTQLHDFTYHAIELSDLPAGKVFEVSVDYDRRTDALNVSASAPSGSSAPQARTLYLVPGLLGMTGVLLILSGAFYYWWSTKRAGTPKARKPHVREKPVSGKIYCKKCGERAQPGDRFCRKCGAYLGEGKP